MKPKTPKSPDRRRLPDVARYPKPALNDALEIIVDLLWVHDRPRSMTGAMGKRMVENAKAFVRRCSDNATSAATEGRKS